MQLFLKLVLIINKMKEENEGVDYNYTYILGVGLLISLVGLYYIQKRFMLVENKYKKDEQPVKPQNILTKKVNLD